VRVLRRRPDRERLLAWLVLRDDSAWFHRIRDEAVVDHTLRDDNLGLGKGLDDRGIVDRLAVGAHARAARHER
jgi:hypothetical protein